MDGTAKHRLETFNDERLFGVFVFLFAGRFNRLAVTKTISFLHVTQPQRRAFLSAGSEKYQPIHTEPTSFLVNECPSFSKDHRVLYAV